jgi:hypothetical protein
MAASEPTPSRTSVASIVVSKIPMSPGVRGIAAMAVAPVGHDEDERACRDAHGLEHEDKAQGVEGPVTEAQRREHQDLFGPPRHVPVRCTKLLA